MSDTPVSHPATLDSRTTDSIASRSRFGRGLGWLFHQPRRLAVIILLLAIIGATAALAGTHGHAYWHYRSGCADLVRHHNAEALRHFQAALRTWPHDSDLLLFAARASWRPQEFEQATNYLKEYQQIAGAGDDFVRESFLIAAAQGDNERAEQICRDRFEKNDDTLACEALVMGLMRQYRLPDAAGYLDKWLALEPNDTQALLLRLSLDQLRRHPDDIIAGYGRILELDPEHDAARFRLASALIETRQYRDALPQLDTLGKRQPKNVAVMVLLAQCRDALGEPEFAEQLLDAVLAREPHDPKALAERGGLALRQGRLEDAEAWLRHAIAHEPGNFQAHYNLGQCLLQAGRTEEVARQQERLKQLEADQKRLRQIMTVEMGRRPNDPALSHEVAMILSRSGDTEAALRWLHRSIRFDPAFVPAHQALAAYYDKTGDRERAVHHRRFLPADDSSQRSGS
jgi:predicted Zn-dependent protease